MELTVTSEESWLSIIMLGLPLVSAIFALLISGRLKVIVGWLTSALMLASTAIAVVILIRVWTSAAIYNHLGWFDFAGLAFDIGFYIDPPAALLLVIVCLVSFLVHLFSIEYMKEDDGFIRYFTFLGLFTFSMIGIVIADNLLIIFMFWELVGFCSYLLIGHWYKKESAVKASKKAFLVNRIGDVGFMIGLAICWSQFQTFDIAQLKTEFSALAPMSIPSVLLTVLGISLFTGAIGKSAQFPLQVWLPDAMEGPTPVSALIHAATMVAAGVYFVFRLYFMMSPDALTIIAIMGSITAFMGAVAAMTQHDIKKVLAFSTISQLGYMIMALGVGAKNGALFLLYTHAFFKAGLFLAAGAIIHSLHKAIHDDKYDVQDMRTMGGLRKTMPVTFMAYLICSLSLIGIPLFSGFLSKEIILIEVLQAALSRGGIYIGISILAFLSVTLTAYYVSRQLLLIFFDTYRGKNETDIHENSILIKTVLIILSVLSIGVVWSLNPFSMESSWVMLKLGIPESSLPHSWTMIMSLSLIIIGLLYSYSRYRPASKHVKNYHNSSPSQNSLAALSFNNWYLDSIYNEVIINPFLKIVEVISKVERIVIDRLVDLSGIFTVVFSNVVGWIDRAIVDGIVNGSVYVVGKAGVITKSISGSKAQSYIILAVIGILIIIFLVL